MTKHYDVIIVGAGNGGLTAAATLSQKGLKTLLIEKHNIPGGCATSFCRGRFEFEPSLHELGRVGSAEKPGDVRKLFNMLGAEVDWYEVPNAFRAINTSKDGYDAVMPTGKQAFIDKMEYYVPGSRKSTEAAFSYAEKTFKALGYYMMNGGKVDPEVMKRDYTELLKLYPISTNEVLKLIGMPKKAQDIFNSYWDYIAEDTDSLRFPVYAATIYRYVTMGSYVPKLRSHEISLALEKVIHKNGGDIWFNTEVTKILMKNGRAYGVATKHGDIYCDHIIANVMPHTVFGKMMDEKEIPQRALKLANARKFSRRPFTVYVGLNKSPEELGIKDYTIFLHNTGDTVKKQQETTSLESNKTTLVTCLNIAVPNCSPEGTSIVSFTRTYSDEAWDGVSVKDYFNVKNKIAEDCIEQYEKACGIKIRDAIEEISVATPLTTARYVGTPGGEAYGYRISKWDSLLERFLSKEEEHFTPGLRFCGGHGANLLGYSSSYLSGNETAMLTLKDIEEER